MWHTPIVYVDIETNGGNGPSGRIIEVAAIKVLDGEIVDTFTSLVNPGSDIPYWITNLTGIQNNDLLTAAYFEDIAQQLYDFLQGSLFAAHSVLFDYSFIKRQFKELGYSYTPELFCTVRLSRTLYIGHKGHSLEKIIQRHSIPVSARHRAYDDALALHSFVTIAAKEHGIDAVTQNIQAQTKTRSLPPNVHPDVIAALPESPGIYIFEDDAGYPLYVGKSINIRTRVKSHFTNATQIAKEMKMSLHSHNVSYIATETEIEALLLESAKIKELQPQFNVKLRRNTKQSLLVKSYDENGYITIHVENKDLGTYTNLQNVYGVFLTKSKAVSSIESLTKTYQLCPKLMGIEKANKSCFRHQLKLCKGACVGKEPKEAYNLRVELALERSKIETWPFAGPIEVTISQTKTMIIDQWIIKYIVDYTYEPVKTPLYSAFDLDTYKILRGYVKKSNAKSVNIEE